LIKQVYLTGRDKILADKIPYIKKAIASFDNAVREYAADLRLKHVR